MTTRSADAEWLGSLREGAGTLKLGSGVFEGAYSFPSRFENGPGTNPEELIAAAHAACFSMALSYLLDKAGFTEKRIHTLVRAHIGITPAGPTLTQIDLQTDCEIPNMALAELETIATAAKTNCLVSRALAGVGVITLSVRLALH